MVLDEAIDLRIRRRLLSYLSEHPPYWMMDPLIRIIQDREGLLGQKRLAVNGLKNLLRAARYCNRSGGLCMAGGAFTYQDCAISSERARRLTEILLAWHDDFYRARSIWHTASDDTSARSDAVKIMVWIIDALQY